MILKSMAQMKAMSNMGSNEAPHFKITSSPTNTSVSSGASVMLVGSREEKHHKLKLLYKNVTINVHCILGYTQIHAYYRPVMVR